MPVKKKNKCHTKFARNQRILIYAAHFNFFLNVNSLNATIHKKPRRIIVTGIGKINNYYIQFSHIHEVIYHQYIFNTFL